ncbi:Ribosomal RNA small subunit methyltransferase A [Geodia barretti]|uniref:rRNA adenine N(6)-methyltransferase n=1 Tax=Geodia barretti TaxID=519541 RepID=A0AA35R5X7_GEOBA|nr:Ribosomal RNA small subunit methyltransferase A [Geodia barretti]
MPSSRNTLRRTALGQSRLGQNFLIDRNIARRIVAAAAIEPGDEVLEIGPGRGALTRLLVERASKVVAVELDEALAADLQVRMGDGYALTVVQQDALEFDPAVYFDGPFKLVANLPYYVATPLVRRYLAPHRTPSEMVVMMQREVANNMTASPGKMGLLSVMVQLHASAKTLFSVPPKAFRPRPKVASAVVKLKPYPEPAIPVGDTDMVSLALIALLPLASVLLENRCTTASGEGLLQFSDLVTSACSLWLVSNGNIEGSRRPATLSIDEW